MRRYRRIGTVLLLGILFSVLLSAGAVRQVQARQARAIDRTGSLTEAQLADLEASLDSLSEKYQCDVIALMVETTSYKTAEQFADDFFDYQGYGMGDDASGILFLVSLYDRDWHFSTSGDARYIFKLSRLEKMGNKVTPYLSAGKYYEAFRTYADLSEEYLEDPEDKKISRESLLFRIAAALGAGGAAGFAITAALKSRLKTVRFQTQAGEYVIPGSFHLNQKEDLFLYSNVTKIPRPKDPPRSSGGGGGGFHISSSGSSHGGHGGKF